MKPGVNAPGVSVLVALWVYAAAIVAALFVVAVIASKGKTE